MESNSSRVFVIAAFIFVALFFIFLGISSYKERERRQLEEEANERRIHEELEKETVHNIDEVYERVEDAFFNSYESNVYMRAPGDIGEDKLKEVADSIDPLFGRVSLYSYTTSSSQEEGLDPVYDYYVGVNYDLYRTDEYYVLKAIQEEQFIPSALDKANTLKDVCEDFLNNNINDSMTDYEKELAVHDYIINNCEYAFSDDNDRTEFQAYGALVNHKAVCEGYARATALLLRLCGIEANLVSGDADSSGDSGGNEAASYVVLPDGKVAEGHMWDQVKIEGNWYNLDTTWDDPISEEPMLTYTYFNVSDEILSNNHTWEEKDAATCNAMDANYYVKNNSFFEDDASLKEYISSQLASGSREPIKCAYKEADISEEAMYFVFDYEGIDHYSYSTHGVDGYTCLELYFNP